MILVIRFLSCRSCLASGPVRVRWATQERFSLSHAWLVGDAVIWDNTGTMDRAMAYPLDGDRQMHRTKLEGEEAFA